MTQSSGYWGLRRIVREWRRRQMPRLYFRSQHQHWRTFESDDFAMAIDGPVRIHYKTARALQDELESVARD